MLKSLILGSHVLLTVQKTQEIQILLNTSLQDGIELLKFYSVLQNILKQLTCGQSAAYLESLLMENQFFQETLLLIKSKGFFNWLEDHLKKIFNQFSHL